MPFPSKGGFSPRTHIIFAERHRWEGGSIVEKLAELAGTNKATTRDEFLHPLFMLSQDESPLGDSSRFDVSLNLGLSGEEHISLAGLAKTRRSSKALLKAYVDAEEVHKDALRVLEKKAQETRGTSEPPAEREVASRPDEGHEEEDGGPTPGQMTLF